MTVLDASALLAWLFQEAGADEVEEALPEACLSTVNLSEVLGRFARDGHDPVPVLQQVQAFGLETVAFDGLQAAEAARLLPLTRPFGLSLGDRACLALARLRGARAMTADQAWSGVEVGVEIRIIR